jgi:hypothetical protein
MNWLGLLTGVPEAIASYFNERQKLKSVEKLQQLELEAAIHRRKIELISQGLTADMNWEMEFARQAETSHKDEYVLAVVSIPAILCFIPKDFSDWQGGAYYVAQGFDALQKTPLWYNIMLVSIFLATYGIRYWRRTQSDT